MLSPVENALLRHQVVGHKMNIPRNTAKNRETKWHPTLLRPQPLVRCSCSHFYGSMRRIMRSYLIGVQNAEDSVPSNSDCVVRSIESLTSKELLALTHHPAASRVLDAIIDGPTILPRSRRALLRAMEAQFADVIDDRIGARVGLRCWAASDPYFKVCCVFLDHSGFVQMIDIDALY